MNEKEFLKKISSKLNNDGTFTYLYICELLREEKMLVKASRKNWFRNISTKFKKMKSAEQIIADNFKAIINKTSGFYVPIVCEYLLENEHSEIINNNIDVILIRMNQGDVIASDLKECLKNLKNTEKTKQYLEENIENIMQITSAEKLFETAQALRGLSENTDNKLNEELENNKINVAKYILDIATRSRLQITEENRDALFERYSNKIVALIDKMLEIEKVKMIDITPIGKGGYSDVFQIGTKVLKVGAPRETSEVPNHPNILKPIIKLDFLDASDNPFTCIEISRKADDLEKDDYKVKNLYELYENLRDDKIIWTDVKFDNIKIG